MFSETLDAIKFICKDMWAACWDKQVDNLRTNHRVCEAIYRIFDLINLSIGSIRSPR